jgi:hypothetical protein
MEAVVLYSSVPSSPRCVTTQKTDIDTVVFHFFPFSLPGAREFFRCRRIYSESRILKQTFLRQKFSVCKNKNKHTNSPHQL